MLSKEQEEYQTIQFEETELRLGLPGGRQDDVAKIIYNGKRGFDETEMETETCVNLKLNLSTFLSVTKESKLKTETSAISITSDPKLKEKMTTAPKPTNGSDPAKPPSKAQVVGWPPVRSFRKNIATVQKKIEEDHTDEKTSNVSATTSAAFVKVSMDGAPYLRKVDLKLYKSYKELSEAIDKMFSSFTIGNCESQGTKDFSSENKLIDLLNGSDYVASYEDKDGDWMLVGDVPWEMFVNSCRRLRIMKGSEAIGLAPRAIEKCKSRS